MHPIAKGVTFGRTDTPADMPLIPLDFLLISQVLTNLIDNALRYASPETAIVVSAEAADEELRLAVFNECTDRPEVDLERLFDKFNRSSTVPEGSVWDYRSYAGL